MPGDDDGATANETGRVSFLVSLSNDDLALLRVQLQALCIDVFRCDRRPNAIDATVDDFLITVPADQADRLGAILRERSAAFRTYGESGQPHELSPVPWFPRTLADVADINRDIFSYGNELDAVHPGFLDAEYRQRRLEIVRIASEYRMGQPIPRIEYTEREVQTWNECFTGLSKLFPTHACRRYNAIRADMFEACGYRLGHVPQLQDVAGYVQKCSGIRIRPVGGLLSPRAFLAGLAFKVYHATQYLRHHSQPNYTPEPDVCHELLGHLPLFCDPEFADFVQMIGLASLGAPDEYTERLSTLLWFTVEFGLCWESGELRAYGGGLLSSVDELKYALSGRPQILSFEPSDTCEHSYAITEMQPVYFAAQSIEKARQQLSEYVATIPRPFAVRFDPDTDRMIITAKSSA